MLAKRYSHRYSHLPSPAKFLVTLLLVAVTFIAAIAAPVRADSAERVTVVLDAGHGGMDGGTDLGIRTEKEYDLILATYIAEYLRANDRFEVIMTRTDDTYLKFLPRALFVRDCNADVLISLHCNSSDVSSAKGTLAIVSKIEPYHSEASALAERILDSISKAVPLDKGKVETRADTGDSLGVYYWSTEHQWDMPAASDLGQTSDYFSINTWASKFGTPSMIVEHGYLSNEYDRTLLDKDENLRAIAKAEAEAVIEFYTGHTHTFSSEMTIDYPSSCSMNGTKSYRCTVCGMKTATTELPSAPEAHYWRVTSRTNATCTEDGHIEYICQISDNLNSKGYACEVHTKTETLAATGHTYEVVEDTPAAHGKDGRYLRRCTSCGEEIDEVRPGEAHDYVVTADVAATCTEDGGITYTCTICADSYTNITESFGHELEELSRTEVSGDENGSVLYRCRICGAEVEEVLHACEHEYDPSTREEHPADCVTDGSITETCKKCGYVREERIPSLGHDMKTVLDVAATCTEEGHYRARCGVCGYEDTRSRPALGHSYIIKEENDTHVIKECTRCLHETEEEATRRSLATIFDKPLVAAIMLVIVIQLVSVPVIRCLLTARFTRREKRKKTPRRFQ